VLPILLHRIIKIFEISKILFYICDMDFDKLRLELIDKLVSGELVIRECKLLEETSRVPLLVLFDVKKNIVVSHWMTGKLSNRLSAVDTFLNDILL